MGEGVRLIDANALRKYAETCRETTDAFCELIDNAPTVEAIPVGWFYEFIRSAGMQGQIGVVQAFRYVLDTWKATREEWDAKQEENGNT